ncbi:PIN domain-containing protein [Rhizobium tumorigenes]|uniref:PIN domain-containing protein n=1 Tax=Rhizobium tumorigenes TaxID=2041385 RepID=A0AAF1KSL4_9HYPH|nr:PIN domain-containing protein [Rhizobium tumorigenes]WFR95965.1 PIN domain-containing protein [Rhizobium tumorigenes]WFS01425.1 PIN domain-containing protein [Rhizobium tumorigenes]
MTTAATNFLDTNILIYAISDDRRAIQAQALLDLPFVVSGQTLNEFANVARKKLSMSWQDTSTAIEAIVSISTLVVPVDEKVTLAALKLAPLYNLSFYDAAMIAAALQAGCKQYYSEDMQHGLVVEKHLTIVNPFH